MKTQSEATEEVAAWVVCLVDFGVGMFNLIVSLLPPTYLSIAELAGYTLDIPPR